MPTSPRRPGPSASSPLRHTADTLALALAETGSLSERRVAVLVDPKMSGLPAFLVENSGLNSGFMIAQVTAAALVSENKTLAAPASVDSIPTSANQEDHVSMATHAARRLGPMVDNAAAVVGIELRISRLHGIWKLSQNQPQRNRHGVVAGLESQGRPHANDVATRMSAVLADAQ